MENIGFLIKEAHHIFLYILEIIIWFVGLSPLRREGALPEILSGPEGQWGGLEIVFNQQLTRLSITSLAASLPQAQRWFLKVAHPLLLYPPPQLTRLSASEVAQNVRQPDRSFTQGTGGGRFQLGRFSVLTASLS